MTYFARFEEIEGDLFRFDTRIYLAGGSPSEESECVGAVVGINPGSARPYVLSEQHELDLHGDKLLPFVRNRFLAAYGKVGVDARRGTYVQVLNLFYLCNQELNQALERLSGLENPPICTSERRMFPVVWYVWGAPAGLLAPLKSRFVTRRDQVAMYMKQDRVSFGIGVPGPMEFVKHTRGMPALPTEQKLVSVLREQAANESLQPRSGRRDGSCLG